MSLTVRNVFVALLLCFFPIQATAETLIPMGEAIRIELQLDGVYVTQDVHLAPDRRLPKGARIVQFNEQSVKRIAHIQQVKDKNTIHFLIDAQEHKLTINQNELIQIQPFFKDTTDGNGTLTYVDPKTNEYGALGHQIVDVQLQRALPFKIGNIYYTNIVQLKKSLPGLPGYKVSTTSNGKAIGDVRNNTSFGIVGHLHNDLQQSLHEPLEIIQANDIQKGEATMYTAIEGDNVRPFSIYIEEVIDETIHFTVTDQALIEQAGGIVQGMSGSPIVQNNYFIGAITHMYIENPVRGTAISITEMKNKLKQ